MRKYFKPPTSGLLLFAHSVFCFFGFRVSRFGFPGEVLGSGFAGLGYTAAVVPAIRVKWTDQAMGRTTRSLS